MALTSKEAAAAVSASRTDFARVFAEAQPTTAPPIAFEAVAVAASEGTDADAFELAIEYAQTHGFAEALVFLLCEAGFDRGALLADLTGEALKRTDLGDLDLQAMQNLQRGLAEPDVVVRGMKRAMRLTTRICVDGAARGTGLLVGPDLVLTAWHVVASLFDRQADGKYVPKTDAGPRLEIELDNVLEVISKNALAPRQRKILKAHADWCVHFSPCHELELKNDLPIDLNELEGFWDYALLRLATSPGAERSWIPLDRPAFVPRAAENVTVFQHAGGQSLRFDAGEIIAADDDTKKRGLGVRRFLHAVNTESGSSGGPCFDRNYVLIGIHQGVWSRSPTNPPNRAIPLARIVRDVGAVPVLAEPTALAWRLSAEPLVPVLAIDEFQQVMWSSVVKATTRVLVLKGESRVGKSFHVQVLAAMLSPTGHLLISLAAPEIANLSATALAQRIADVAGAKIGDIVPAHDIGSTTTIWLRDELLQKLLNALDTARNGRTVWLCIQELNKTEIRDAEASEFLFMFYEAAIPRPWLRIVLDGMRGDLPATLEALIEVRRVERPDTKTATRAVVDFITRAVVNDKGELNEAAARLVAADAAESYEEARDSDSTKAMEALSRAAVRALKRYRAATEDA